MKKIYILKDKNCGDEAMFDNLDNFVEFLTDYIEGYKDLYGDYPTENDTEIIGVELNPNFNQWEKSNVHMENLTPLLELYKMEATNIDLI